MKIKCVIDTEKFNNKPQSYETGGIIKRMIIDTANDYSADEIIDNILQGKTVRPSYCGGREESWLSQQMFMIDIDNEANLTSDIVLGDYIKLVEGKKNKVRFLFGSKQHKTYDDIINHCNNINLTPSFMYVSFNHKAEQHKMRLVYILDKPKLTLFFRQFLNRLIRICNINKYYFTA